MFRVHFQMYQRLVIAQCNMFRNFEDKPWQDRYFPYRTVRDSGTCWSVPFCSCKSSRTVSRPALHDACLSSICESRAHLDCVILCYYWLIRICLRPARHWHISPFYVILLTSSMFFYFDFDNPTKIYCISWFIHCEIFYKILPWANVD